MQVRVAQTTLVTLAIAALSGCGLFGSDAKEPTAQPGTRAAVPSATASSSTATPSSAPVLQPAAAAGPACAALTYDTVAALTGVRYEVAASSGVAGKELVCVLQGTAEGSPDLTYVANPVAADPESFKLDFQPNGTAPVAGLGKAAYSRVAVGGDAGRVTVELGWLGRSAVYTLTYTAPGAPAAPAQQKLVAGLIALAKKLPA